MAHCIAKIDGKYLVWSSIVDAPVSSLMTLEDLREYHLREHGPGAWNRMRMPRALELVEERGERGTSSLISPTVEDLIEGNRAGENESELTLKEIVEQYTNSTA